MSEVITETIVPSEIITCFYGDGQPNLEILNGGIVNSTLCVTDAKGEKSILQRLSPIFDASMATDFDVVSRHLRLEGWEVALDLKTLDGKSYVNDNAGNLWRAFTFIESDGVVPAAGPEANVALSGLLGALHNSLSRIDYKPRFALPHFHETTFYANKLEGLLPDLKEPQVKALGATCIALSREKTISPEPSQLIHGDPKMANALYRDGKPFTFVDFDTLMCANPLVDVGDMLRSITSKSIGKDSPFNIKNIDPIIQSYYQQAKPQANEAEFIRQAYNAGQVIALELGIRYLADAVEDTYFDWDRSQFASRREHNIARVQTQWQTYEALNE